ncbi:MAG TPA: hypothetical protein VGV38_09965 [Pyrinomonadaceae bacterium]|nr:hypothetical protein [Pyrinomonadaceae bacterium]
MSENDNQAAAAAAPEAAGEGATGAEAAGEVAAGAAEDEASAEAAAVEEITYHAVEKDGQVTAIWEMQGRKHLRTIDPRSRQGLEILRLYTAEHGEHA